MSSLIEDRDLETSRRHLGCSFVLQCVVWGEVYVESPASHRYVVGEKQGF